MSSRATSSATLNPTRKWDELRVASVVPSRISTLPLSTLDDLGVGSLFKVFGFGKDWLWIEGIDDFSNFRNQNFEFEKLDYPHEWAASVKSQSSATLKVGKSCQCSLAGVAVYAKSDNTAWVRLHFEQCSGCESTAARAAVVVGLVPSSSLDSNLYEWMCAVYPHGACAPREASSPPGRESGTLAAATPAPAPHPTAGPTPEPATTAQLATTTTLNLACSFLSVATEKIHVGKGQCLGNTYLTRKVSTEMDCEVACNVLYEEQVAYFGGLDELNSHVAEINGKSEVCKGYAFNSKTSQCTVYTEGTVTKADGHQDWECFGRVSVKENGYAYHFDYTSAGCTTQPAPPPTTSTATTTTRTSTTTTVTHTTTTQTQTTTTTTRTEMLSLAALFGSQEQRARVFGFPGDVHFQDDGMEATMLQLQSKCFEDVDYYMLGGTLPILESRWESLMQMLTHFGASDAWLDTGARCLASATIDRIPVDMEASRRGGSSSKLTWAGKLVSTVLSAALVSLLGLGAATWARGTYYPTGIAAPSKMSGAKLAAYLVVAVVAACLTFALVYSLGLVVCWFAGRLARKKLAMGGSGSLLLAGPALSGLCLPAAAAAAGAAAVIWLWPSGERQPQRHYKRHKLLVSYDPVSGDIRPVLS